MIDHDAKPIGNVPAYQPINLRYPGRKPFISSLEVVENGGHEPDPAVYRRDDYRDGWVLK